MSRYRYVLDCAHGGTEWIDDLEIPMTKGKRMGEFIEGVWSREVVHCIAGKLSANSIDSHCSTMQNMDYSLRARVKYANTIHKASKDAVSISVHANASGMGRVYNNAHGATVFYKPFCQQSKTLAGMILNELGEGNFMSTRRGIKSKYFAMLKPNCPSVLVEAGFYTSREDQKRLEEYEEVAHRICNGIYEAELEGLK